MMLVFLIVADFKLTAHLRHGLTVAYAGSNGTMLQQGIHCQHRLYNEFLTVCLIGLGKQFRRELIVAYLYSICLCSHN